MGNSGVDTQRQVWHYESLDIWRQTVLDLLLPIVDSKVIQEFRRRPPKYVVSDDLSWLDRIIKRVNGTKSDSKRFLASQLRDRYEAIRAYHGARPVDISTYYAQGIKLMDPERIEQQARDFFLSGRYPEISAEDVETAIQGVGRATREGRAYFEANKSELEEHCAHYMLYGSEFITGVAANLTLRGRDYRQELKSIGKPTVFLCDVPLSLMSESSIEEFAGSAIEAIFEEFLQPGYHHPQEGRGSALSIRETLSPEYIVDHYQPARLRDPLLSGWLVNC